MAKSPKNYHPSYSNEENLMMDAFFQSASKSELIEGINKLIELSPIQEKLTKAMNQLVSEITERDIMKQRYDILVDCKSEWNSYVNNLIQYEVALYVREKYQQAKKEYSSINSSIFYNNCIDKESNNYDKIISRYSEEFIRRCTFKEDSKNAIKLPAKPHIYLTIEEIPVTEPNYAQSLEKLGKENLKYLLSMLLQFSDNTENENIADIIISFFTRTYARQSHKRENSLFVTKLTTYEELKKSIFELLQEIKDLKLEAEKQLNSMNL